jgi:uncharacterized protein YjiS (DUF1127 family)
MRYQAEINVQRYFQEDVMSTFSFEAMTNNHDSGVLGRLRTQLHLWSDRWHQRQELSHWSEHELHDIGLTRSEAARETEKPFWRA